MLPRYPLSRILRSTSKSARRNRLQFRPDRQRLSLERLEDRRVLAAYINEFHFSPQFGTAVEDQYLEFRGAPNSTLDAGTYFIGIESADGVNELGDVHTILDLSGQSFGANGLLVVLPSASGYEVYANATVLQGSDGFRGMPGGAFVADGDANVIHAGSSTYLLVQSSTPPQLTDDIDANDDGLPDGAYLNWTVLDSFAMLPWVESVWQQSTYASIVFAEDAVGDTNLPNATVVTTDQLAYAGRIGDSVGYGVGDWMTGNTVEAGDDTFDFQLQHGVFGTPRPFAYGGRFLDHVGASNWYGTIQGSIFHDYNANGIQETGEAPTPGIQVVGDRDGNGQAGYYWETIEPDDFAVDTDLSNISSNVTIVSAGADNVHQGFKIRATQRTFEPAGTHIFSHEGVGFFNENRRLRMDFYTPVRSVSIDVIGDSDLRDTFGRLEIFNSAGSSLGFIRTAALNAGDLQTLTLSTGLDEIAWAVAYPEDSYLASSPFGMLDNLRFEQRQITAVTDANGEYQLQGLTNGDYSVTIVGIQGYTQVFPANDASQNVVVRYDTNSGVNFGLEGTTPPSLDNQTISVGELSAAGTVLSDLPVALGYLTQQLQFNVLSGDPTGLFEFDTESFQLRLARGELDFESTSEYTLEIEIVDTANSSLKDTATLQINVLNENDAPVVESESATLLENSADGSFVATMSATDQDAGAAGTLTWSIVGGNTADVFAIDGDTGEVTVLDNGGLDFETTPLFELVVRATDGGTPSNFGDATLAVTLTNVNEAPLVPEQSLSVLENAASGTLVGQLVRDDPDAGQTALWSLTGGDGQALFELSSDGLVTVADGANLDFETRASYELEVQVDDSGDPVLFGSGVISISLSNANDPPEIAPQEFSVAENAKPGTVIGTVLAMDQDAGQTLAYTVSGGEDQNAFVIDPATGEITVAENAVLDFESRSALTIHVTVTDSHGQKAHSTAEMVINLLDQNEAPKVETTQWIVPENSDEGSSLGAVDVTDPDSEDVLTFELVNQSLDWFLLDAATGELTVKPGAKIDFEAVASMTFTVKVTDEAGLSDEAEVVVSVLDANDAPRLVNTLSDQDAEVDQPFVFQIPEDAFFDEDANDSLRFSVTTAAGFSLPNWLFFDAASRTLSGTPSLEDRGQLSLRVSAVDNARALATDTFDINIQDNPYSWHNPALPSDTDGDGFVSPIDALRVINFLNNNDDSLIPPETLPEFGLIDVTGDGLITPFDALTVINILNADDEGEGESSAVPRALAGNLSFDWSDNRKHRREFVAQMTDAEIIELISLSRRT